MQVIFKETFRNPQKQAAPATKTLPRVASAAATIVRFSGVILVMQANGLYMLKVPKLVHDEALVPLGREVSRLRDEMAETVSRHAEVTKDTFAVCEKTRQVAEAAALAAKELDGAIRDGWREVNTEKLAARIQGNWKPPSCVRSPRNAAESRK